MIETTIQNKIIFTRNTPPGHIPNQASGFGKTFTETSNMRLMEHYRNIETDKAIDRMREREIQTDTIGKPQFRLQDVSLQMKEYMQARSFNGGSVLIKRF